MYIYIYMNEERMQKKHDFAQDTDHFDSCALRFQHISMADRTMDAAHPHVSEADPILAVHVEACDSKQHLTLERSFGFFRRVEATLKQFECLARK